jgi:hypothetical protein
MMTCQTCKHWVDPLSSNAEDGWRECKLARAELDPKAKGDRRAVYHPRSLMRAASPSDQAILLTRPLHYCTNWDGAQ